MASFWVSTYLIKFFDVHHKYSLFACKYPNTCLLAHTKSSPILGIITDPSSHSLLKYKSKTTAELPSAVFLFPVFHAYTGLSQRAEPTDLEDHMSMLQLMYTGQNFAISLQARYATSHLFVTLTSILICAELGCVLNQEKTVSCHGRHFWPKFKMGHGFRYLN